MTKKKIKVGILKNSKLILDFWIVLKSELNKKYDIEIKELFAKENLIHYDRMIDKIKKKDFDMLIGEFLITDKRYKQVDFTFPLYFIAPRIIYMPKNNNQFEYLLYIKYLISGWIKPISILLCFGLIIGFIINKSDSKRGFRRGVYHTISAFLGETSNLVSNTNTKSVFSIISTVIALIFVYLFTIYFTSITVVRSISYFKKSNKLEETVKGERIFVDKNMPSGEQSYNSIKKRGGIPIEIKIDNNVSPKKYIDYYIKNSKSSEGIVITGVNLKSIADENNLEISDLFITSSLPISLPISKKNKDLLYDVNIILFSMKNDGSLEKICERYINPLDMSTYC
jgi:ABC-type amino acid transport substrate-binding protein